MVLDDFGELLVDVRRVDFHIFLFQVGGLKRKLLKYLFKDGVKPSSTDVFGLLVDAGGKLRDRFDGVFGYVELQPLGFKQGDVLLDQRVFRFRENADEVLFLERLQFDANRQPALQLRDQIRRFGDVGSAGRNEQDG